MRLAARARMFQDENLAFGDEDAVVGFGVAAGEVVEVDFGEGGRHDVEEGRILS